MVERRAPRGQLSARTRRLLWGALLVVVAVPVLWWSQRPPSNADAGHKEPPSATVAADKSEKNVDGELSAPTPPHSGSSPSPSTSPSSSGSTEIENDDESDPQETTGPNRAAVEPDKPLPKPVRARLDQVANLTDAVTVEIRSIELVEAVGRGAGELGGSALSIVLEINNTSRKPLDLSTVVVTVDTGEDDPVPAPAIETAGEAEPLSGTLKPTTTARGTYVFLAPDGDDPVLHVSFSTSTSEPVLLFTGRAGA